MRMLFFSVAVIMGAVGAICGHEEISYKAVMLLGITGWAIVQVAYVVTLTTHVLR